LAKAYKDIELWLWVALFLLVTCLVIAMAVTELREAIVELVDPIMPLRSGTDTRIPGPRRECARTVSRVLAVGCAAVAVWEIPLASSPQPPRYDTPEDFNAYGEYGEDHSHMHDWNHDHHHGYGHHDEDEMDHRVHYEAHEFLLLRWKPLEPGLDEATNTSSEDDLLAAATRALGAAQYDLTGEDFLQGHRLLVFRHLGHTEEERPKHTHWQEILSALGHPPRGSNLTVDATSNEGSNVSGEATIADTAALLAVADNTFPAFLESSLCDALDSHSDKSTVEVPVNILDDATTTTSLVDDAATTSVDAGALTTIENHATELAAIGDAEARAAYAAACGTWRRMQTPYHHYDHHDDHYDHHHGHHGWYDEHGDHHDDHHHGEEWNHGEGRGRSEEDYHEHEHEHGAHGGAEETHEETHEKTNDETHEETHADSQGAVSVDSEHAQTPSLVPAESDISAEAL